MVLYATVSPRDDLTQMSVAAAAAAAVNPNGIVNGILKAFYPFI